MAKRKKRSLGLGFFGTGIFIWDRISDYLQAKELWQGRGPLMEWIGQLIDQWWFGPAIVVTAVVSYIGMGAISDWFHKLFGNDDEAPPTHPPTNVATGGSVSDSGNSNNTNTNTRNSLVVNFGPPAPPTQSTPPSPPEKPKAKIPIILEEIVTRDLKFGSGYDRFSVRLWLARVFNESTDEADTAKNIRASLLFRAKNQPSLHVDGYWIWDMADLQTELTAQWGSAQHHKETWIQPRERKHIVLIVKADSGQSVCAFDHKSTVARHLKRPELQLPTDDLEVEIEIIGQRVHSIHEYLLTNDGRDSSLIPITRRKDG